MRLLAKVAGEMQSTLQTLVRVRSVFLSFVRGRDASQRSQTPMCGLLVNLLTTIAVAASVNLSTRPAVSWRQALPV